METVAITVVGQDRPGIVAAVTGALADLNGNIEDSSMTLLRGSFAWMLVVAVPVDQTAVVAALSEVRELGLSIDVVALPDTQAVVTSPTHAVAVHGADRPGIVAAVTEVIAKRGGNITDLSTRLSGPLYVMAADVSLPTGVEVQLQSELTQVAELLDVEVAVHKIDIAEGF